MKGTCPMATTTSRLLKGAAALPVSTVLLTAGIAPAAAHVTANATSTAENSYTQITFSAPTESDTASTSKLEVQLPTDTPFTSVRTKPVIGWTAEITTEKLPEPVTTEDSTITEAATRITWTADGPEHEIGPDEFQAFTISAGRLPEAGTEILLPATQTYTDGEVVEWKEPTVQGEERPEHPAPSLTVTAAEEGSHGNGTASGAVSGEAVLGWAALAAGVLGLALAVLALARTRRQP